MTNHKPPWTVVLTMLCVLGTVLVWATLIRCDTATNDKPFQNEIQPRLNANRALLSSSRSHQGGAGTSTKHYSSDLISASQRKFEAVAKALHSSLDGDGSPANALLHARLADPSDVNMLLGIGVQKGGTTTLFEYLRHFEFASLAVIKQLHFFDKKLSLNRSSWEDYLALFPNEGPVKIEVRLREPTSATVAAVDLWLACMDGYR
eukprot:m.141789 g.141789  ORF g.141789 m.141789 type:complete len:205 (-) comp16139_c1_seq1:1370-1984(-)